MDAAFQKLIALSVALITQIEIALFIASVTWNATFLGTVVMTSMKLDALVIFI